MKRGDMKPGTIFVSDERVRVRGITAGGVKILVVVDDLHEVDFYTGARYAYGDAASGREFEVVTLARRSS